MTNKDVKLHGWIQLILLMMAGMIILWIFFGGGLITYPRPLWVKLLTYVTVLILIAFVGIIIFYFNIYTVKKETHEDVTLKNMDNGKEKPSTEKKRAEFCPKCENKLESNFKFCPEC